MSGPGYYVAGPRSDVQDVPCQAAAVLYVPEARCRGQVIRVSGRLAASPGGCLGTGGRGASEDPQAALELPGQVGIDRRLSFVVAA